MIHINREILVRKFLLFEEVSWDLYLCAKTDSIFKGHMAWNSLHQAQKESPDVNLLDCLIGGSGRKGLANPEFSHSLIGHLLKVQILVLQMQAQHP